MIKFAVALLTGLTVLSSTPALAQRPSMTWRSGSQTFNNPRTAQDNADLINRYGTRGVYNRGGTRVNPQYRGGSGTYRVRNRRSSVDKPVQLVAQYRRNSRGGWDRGNRQGSRCFQTSNGWQCYGG